MEFLKKENYKLLLDIITEEVPNVNIQLFDSVFRKYGAKEITSEKDLLALNKGFVFLFMNLITKPSEQTFPLVQNEPIDATHQKISQLKRVSFDTEVEKHRQHFQQLAAPPIPPMPNFSDDIKESKINLEALVKQTLMSRNYDVPIQKPPPRLLEIGSIIPDTEVQHNIIPLQQPEQQSPPTQTTPQNLTKINSIFFSKLQQIAEEEKTTDIDILPVSSLSGTVTEKENPSKETSSPNIFPLSAIQSLQEDNTQIKKDIEDIKLTLSKLQQFLENSVANSSNTYSETSSQETKP